MKVCGITDTSSIYGLCPVFSLSAQLLICFWLLPPFKIVSTSTPLIPPLINVCQEIRRRAGELLNLKQESVYEGEMRVFEVNLNNVYFSCSATLFWSARCRLFSAVHSAHCWVLGTHCQVQCAHFPRFRKPSTSSDFHCRAKSQQAPHPKYPSIPSILTWELLFNKQASGSHSIPYQRVSKLRITSILNWERRIALVWFHWSFLWLTLRSHYHKQVEFEFVAKPKG